MQHVRLIGVTRHVEGSVLPIEKKMHGLQRVFFLRIHSSIFPSKGSSSIIITHLKLPFVILINFIIIK